MTLNIESIPVFIKAGSFIPMVEAVNSTDFYSSQELTFRYFPSNSGDTSSYTMFEDDGETYGTIGRGEFELIVVSSWKADEKTRHFELKKDGWDYEGMPLQRVMKFEIVGQSTAKKSIFLNGEKMRKKKPDDLIEGYYLSEQGVLVVDFNWMGNPVKLDIIEK